ncbi:MAG: TonB-dependent receptor [Candidatus Eremiobacteraeota bacterium]|nr:TonB-dependent receptor [Candidatus Eremiobacteraeota bacterium]
MSFVRTGRIVFSAVLAFLFLAISTSPVSAGTTGSLSGTVVDSESGQAVADATVSVTSPSQNGSAHTDAAGKYVFISLVPDSYTVSVQKSGYEPTAISGISVFADQTQTVQLTLVKSLKTIATVTSRSSLSPVKAGTTTDVYSVNPALTAAAAPIGGGGGLNNAYSAIAAMPGAFVPPGQMGVNQTVYIRGGYYDQIGYEYDGVPVNRSFDNYPAHSASTLGQQELQIYTGGGTANANATGLAGFINQVVKSGTFPGYGTVQMRLASPAFYHDISAEAGGASPNRLFSYYAGLSGFNQEFRYWNNSNGADLTDQFPNAGELTTGPNNVTTNLLFYPAVYPTCDPSNPNLYTNPAVTPSLYADPGCFSSMNPVYGNISGIRGREAVANLHFGIPHKRDGGRDDIQLLFTNSAQFRQYYTGVNDAGADLVNALVNFGDLHSPHWPDFLTFPSGTAFLAPASTQPIAYAFPGSPGNRCYNVVAPFVKHAPPVPNACPDGSFAPLPPDYRDARWDQASIVKAQYQKNIGSNAYLRVFGYTFYSNTNRSGAARRGIGSGFSGTNFDYEVDAHTRGAQMQFADQINGTNQIMLNLNYVTSTTFRFNNGNYNNTASQQISNLTNGTQCFAYTSGPGDNGIDMYNAGDPAPCNDSITQGTFRYPNQGQGDNPCTGSAPLAGTPACTAGATWGLTFTGNQGPVNSVTPKFTNLALTDEWKPSDRLDVNASLRFSRDQFVLADTNTPGKNFWYHAAQNEFCYDPATFNPILVPQAPQNASTLQPYVTFNCPVVNGVQTLHPNGQDGAVLLSNEYPGTWTQTYAEPRFGLTYSLNPDTVLRFSAGRYAQEPQNYEVQYNSAEENLAAELVGFMPFGFFTPLHEAGAQFSNNYDFSVEHHIKGTDMSFKITPFYRWATDQLYETVNVPTLNASPSLNSGTQRNTGVELLFTKGDFNRNGLSGMLSYTYTNSKEKWDNYANVPINPVDPYNQDIQNFNALTQAGGGAQCYANNLYGQNITGISYPSGMPSIVPDPSCAPLSYTDTSGTYAYTAVINNPYFAVAKQPLLDKFAWYDTGLDYPYVSPSIFAAVLNYRHDRLAITPAFTLNEGATYGTPAEFVGIDPRTCAQNQAAAGITTGNPLNADYTSCGFAQTSTGTSVGSLFVPNPVTGTFDSFGRYRQPWQFNMGLQVSYDVSPRITANLTVANLLNHCFGGSKMPWTQANPPNRNVCGYYSNPFYISNFYNGSSPNDAVANGVPLNPFFQNAFVPAYGDTNSYNYPLPLQFYFQLQLKL